MPTYTQFYHQFGVRFAVLLAAPRLREDEKFKFPQYSVLHYVPNDEAEYGPDQNDPMFNGVERLMFVRHTADLAATEGNPRKLHVNHKQMAREYHRQNRRTRELLNEAAPGRDPQMMLIQNYALLNHLYRYPVNFFRSYYKWSNQQATVWNTVAELCKVYPNRNHYITVGVPKQLPKLAMLKAGERGLTRTTLKFFSTPTLLNLLDIWKWLGDTRELSLINKVPVDDLKRVNLIIRDSGRWIMVNLGQLNSWRMSVNEEEPRPEGHAGKIAPVQLQRVFLRSLMAFIEARGDGGSSTALMETAELAPEASERIEPETGETVTEVTTVAKATPVQLTVANADGSVSKIKITNTKRLEELDEGVELDHESNLKAIDEAITKDLEALDHLEEQVVDKFEGGLEDSPTIEESSGSLIAEYVPGNRDHTASVMRVVDMEADAGRLSGAEYRRMQALASAHQKLPNPFTGKGSLTELMKIEPEELKLTSVEKFPDSPAIPDKSMLESVLVEYDQRYIEKILPKDITRAVMGVQLAGIAVTSFEMTEKRDALNHYQEYAVQLTPVVGQPSTVYFKLPVIDAEDGTFIDNGTRYRLRKQRVDVPIRKTAPDKVALTSYYSKVFVSRGQKKVNDYMGWLTNQIAMRAMDDNDTSVTKAALADVFDNTFRAPRIYSTMAMRFRSFETGDIQFHFDHETRHAVFGEDRVKAVEADGLLVIGRRGDSLLVVDNSNTIYETKGLDLSPLGTMEAILNVEGRSPTEIAEVRLSGKQVPVGIVLAYYLGLTQLFKLLKVTPRRVPTGTRLNQSDDEVALRFEDETLLFPKDLGARSMILGGILSYAKYFENYPVHLFDRKDIYFNVLEQAKLGVRAMREMDLLNELFVDPITEDLLKEMGEPTDFIGLLLRSCELLETDWAPDETDLDYMRLKGYERMAGAVYLELVRSIRHYRSRGSMAKVKIEMHPRAVWSAIKDQDPVLKQVEEINPIHNMREREEVTFSGTGGRSGRSMVGRVRVFHQNDIGVISESTKDSKDVAITTFTTSNPNIIDVRGRTRRFDPKVDGAAKVMSSPALLSPSADRDDGKRVNFIPIQHSSTTFAKGYRPTPLRTGAEKTVSHRTDKMFAQSAKRDGVVLSRNERAITIKYDDDTVVSFELGRRFGTAAGTVFPHELATTLEAGQKVKKGQTLFYNTRYFQPDPLDPGQVLWKAGMMVRTAILESTSTLEDSSEISERIAQEMETEVTYVRDITVDFKQTIHGLVETGSETDIETILCTIEDAVTAENKLFDETSLDTLRLVAANTPRAKYKGRVEKIDVFYHGEVDDMSPSLQDIAMTADRRRKRTARDLNQSPVLGKVDGSMRLQGQQLPGDTMVIRVYITVRVPAGVGDKGVFASQLKTIFGRVMSGVNKTESGEDLDAIFSYQSIANRIVRSTEIIGVSNTILKHITKEAVRLYRGK